MEVTCNFVIYALSTLIVVEIITLGLIFIYFRSRSKKEFERNKIRLQDELIKKTQEVDVALKRESETEAEAALLRDQVRTKEMKIEEVIRQQTYLQEKLTNVNEEKEDVLKQKVTIQEKLTSEIIQKEALFKQNSCLLEKLTTEEFQTRSIQEKLVKEIKENEAVLRQNANLQREIDRSNLEKEDALKRLSELMSSRLKDGNPNVVDINDPNRPTKVGDHFIELYDNEWTDAYGIIENFARISVTESEITQILLDILVTCFKECKTISLNQMNELHESVTHIVSIVTKNNSNLTSDLMQPIKEERKRCALDFIPDFKLILGTLKDTFSSRQQDPGFLDEQTLNVYTKECLKLSWLMVMQDPPMTMIFDPEADNYEQFKAYKTGGKLLKYTVWPALLLHEGGPLIAKGVAEFASDHNEMLMS